MTDLEQLDYYERLISKATGITNRKQLMEIEDIMRGEHSTFDHLTRERFSKLARMAALVWSEVYGPNQKETQ